MNHVRQQIFAVSKENVTLEQTMLDLRATHKAELLFEEGSIAASHAALREMVAAEETKIAAHAGELAAVEAAFTAQRAKADAAAAELRTLEQVVATFDGRGERAKRQREDSAAEAAGFDADRKKSLHRMAALEYQRRKHAENLDALKATTAREVQLEDEARRELEERLSVVGDLDAKIRSLRTKHKEA